MVDFTKLNNLASEESEPKTSPKEPLESVNFTPSQLGKISEERERLRQAYKDYQENIKNSSDLRISILKGLKAGKPLEVLFLEAVKCISCMTGDTVIFTQSKRDLLQLYGISEDTIKGI